MKNSDFFGTCLVFLVSECIIAGAVSWQWQRAAPDRRTPWAEQLRQFDAHHYEHLAQTGYTYSPDDRSEVAFFPAWPLAARVASRLTRLPPLLALLALANAFLFAAFFAFRAYLGNREGDSPIFVERKSGQSPGCSQRRVIAYSLWAFALWPPTFFFRMPYSEALFVLVSILALGAMQRRWPLPWIAAIVGLATAVRSAGVALLLPLVWHTIQGKRGRSPFAGTSISPHPRPLSPLRGARGALRTHGDCPLFPPDGWRRRLVSLLWVLPLGCWGLLAYMTFLHVEFGNALCFAQTQWYWRMRPDLGLWDKALSLASWEPFWAIYVRGMPGYFGGFSDWNNVLGRMHFFNPIFFGGTAVLIAVGAHRRWLSSKEVLLSTGLLVVPYLTRAYEMCMESHARFAAIVFPVYIVLGEILARLPRVLAWVILGLSAALLVWFTAGYAAGRPFF